MDQVLQFAVIGLSTGAIYAVLATSLVAVYSATGLINFAQGSITLWAVWQTAALRYDGTLVLPVGSVSLSDEPLPTAPAFAIGVASAVAISLLAHFLVFKPLRKAPALAQVVASIGVMLLIQTLVTLRFDTITIISIPAVLPTGAWTLGEATLPHANLLLAALALLVALVFWVSFRFTTWGTATRAAAESEQAARLMGFSPDALAAVVWTMTGALSSIVVILAATKVGLDPMSYTFYVVPALAVALVGRLSSVVVAAVAGLVLGIIQSEIFYLASFSWWPHWAQQSFADCIPFLVVVIALFALGGRIPARGSTGEIQMPAVSVPRFTPFSAIGGIGLIGGTVIALVLTSGTWRYGIISSIIMTLLALSLVLLTGYLGQISLATMAFAGTAGFLLSKVGMHWGGIPFPFDMVLAVLGATLAGILVGIPALRIRGAQLAVVTLAAALALQNFVFGNTVLTPFAGHTVAHPEIFGRSLGVRHGDTLVTIRFGLLALVVVTVTTLAVALIMRGATGRAFLAVRSNERAAASAGINVAGTKLLGFALSAFIAGIGGCLIAYSRGQVSVASFTVMTGLTLLAMAYLGGITSITGAVIAGLVAPLGVVHTFFHDTVAVGEYYALVAALLLILTAVFNPTGVAGTVAHLKAHRSHRPVDEPTAPVETKEPVHV